MKVKGLRFLGAVVGVALAGAAFAEPRVVITDIERDAPNGEIVRCTYTVSGISSGETYCLDIKVDANVWAYAYHWIQDVKNGTATANINVKTLLGNTYPNVTLFAELKENPAVQLWAGGPYWATCNVGATKPEEYGYYFWWGDTVGYVRDFDAYAWVSAKDGTTTIVFSKYDATVAQTYGKNASDLQSAGFTDTSGGNLNMAHDAARAHLGGSWRMPTPEDFDALRSNCMTTWTTRNGVDGCLITGKGDYASKSIFLPAAGIGTGSSLSSHGHSCYYWSSTPAPGYWNENEEARSFHVDGNLYPNVFNSYRSEGLPVRPVR